MTLVSVKKSVTQKIKLLKQDFDWSVCRLSFQGLNAEYSGTPTSLNRLGILRDQAIHYSPVALGSTGAVARRDRFIEIDALSLISLFCTCGSWLVVAVKIIRSSSRWSPLERLQSKKSGLSDQCPGARPNGAHQPGDAPTLQCPFHSIHTVNTLESSNSSPC